MSNLSYETNLVLDNGITISIVWALDSFSSAYKGSSASSPSATFEVALFVDGRAYTIEECSSFLGNIIGWATREEIASVVFRAASATAEDVAGGRKAPTR